MQLPLTHPPDDSPKPHAQTAPRKRSILVTVVVLLVLRVHVHYESDATGARHLVIDKPSVDLPVVGAIVSKLLGLPSGAQR